MLDYYEHDIFRRNDSDMIIICDALYDLHKY